ncbi:hypothetical protein [Bradyrhizobium liaoningense]
MTQLLIAPSVVMIVAALLALSLASAERTFEGMRSFTGSQTLSVWVSVLITFGVQVLMLVLAWRIGDAYATGGSPVLPGAAKPPMSSASRIGHAFTRSFAVRNFLLLLSFGVCALICVFFSFDAFYQGISSEDHRTTVSNDAAKGIVRKIDAELARQLEVRQNEIAAKLTGGSAPEEYARRINAVIATADDPGVIEAFKAREGERRKENEARLAILNDTNKAAQFKINEADRVRKEAVTAKEALESDRDARNVELARLVERQAALAQGLIDKQAEIDRALAVRDKEAEDGNGKLKRNGEPNAGKGEKYRRYDAALNDRVREKQTLEREKVDFDRGLTAKTTARDEIKKQIATAELAVANAEAELKTAQAAAPGLASAPGRSGERSLPGSANLTDEKAKLLTAQDAFLTTPTKDNWAAIEVRCNQLLSLLREPPDVRGKTTALQCSPSVEMRALSEDLATTTKRRADFKAGCSDASGSVSQFAELVDHGWRCLRTAQLDDKSLETELLSVSQEQDKNAHTFTRTIKAFQRRDTLAYIAVVIALCLDGLIFLCGIWGARANISHLARHADETAGEIDEHAGMIMNLEVRPERLRPPGGWPEPAEVYKARTFMRHLEPYNNPDQPGFGGAINFAGLGELERDAVKSVFTIGPFAQLIDNTGIWIVSKYLIRYLTRIAASYDYVQRLHQAREAAAAATPAAAVSQAEPMGSPRADVSPHAYWANAARVANGGRIVTDSGTKSEEELIDYGFRKFVEDPGPVRPSVVANDNPVGEPADRDDLQQGEPMKKSSD